MSLEYQALGVCYSRLPEGLQSPRTTMLGPASSMIELERSARRLRADAGIERKSASVR